MRVDDKLGHEQSPEIVEKNFINLKRYCASLTSFGERQEKG